jgi:hypothetical protein
VAVYIGEELASEWAAAMPCAWPVTSRTYPGEPTADARVPDYWPVARDRIRYMGEIVTVVVADTREHAVDTTEAIEVDYDELPVVDGFAHRRVDQRLIERDHGRGVGRPQVLPILRRLGDEDDLGDLAGDVARYVPLAVFVLRVSSRHVAVGLHERWPAIVAVRHQHLAWERHPDKRSLGEHVDVHLAGVVELAGGRAGSRRRIQSASEEVVPVVIERRPGEQVTHRCRCVEARHQRHGHLPGSWV